MMRHYPSLLLLITSDQARWWCVEKDTVEDILYIKDEPSTYSDREGYFRMARGGKTLKSGEPDMRNRRRAEDVAHHVRRITEETVRLLQGKEYVHLCCILPEKIAHSMKEQFSTHGSLNIDIHMRYGNFIHASTRDIRDLFLQCLRHD